MIRKLIVVDGPAEREIVLAGTVVVGRDPACTVSDLDPLLSRRHAEFVVGQDGALVRDLKSRNGILVNGVKLAEHLLAPGDIVQLGHLHVRYVEEEPPVIEHDPRAHATTATGMAPTIAVLGSSVPRGHAAPAPPPAGSQDASPLDDGATRRTAATETHQVPVDPGTPDEPDPAGNTELDVTTMPSARPAPEPAMAPPRPYAPDDFDSTRLAGNRYEAEAGRAARPARPEVDPDATMFTPPPLQAGQRPAAAPASQAVAERPTEGWLVADASLTITETSPACAALLRLGSKTLVGASLGETLANALGHVSSGDGPSPLSLSIERGRSTGALTITVTAGKASGISS